MLQRRGERRQEERTGYTVTLWNADYISAEQNLESIGYFSATYSRRSITDTRASKMVELSGDRTIEILPSKKYGLPNAEDLDFYRAFLKICYERARLVKSERDGRIVYHPELPVPIGFSSRELTIKANKRWSGRASRSVREWIERLNSTTIHGAIFSAKEQRYDVRMGLEPLFRQYVHVGRPMADGQIASQNFVWPAQWFIDNYYYLYTRPIDLLFHHRLSCSIAKSLYPLLDAGWFASNGSPYRKRYTDLCAVLDIQVYKQLSRVQQQLEPSHDELVREKFIASYDYPCDDLGQWTGTIRWWPGAKWLYDQESKQKRRSGRENAASLPISETQEVIELSPQSTAAQLALPMTNRRAVEVPELYEQRVKNFYTSVGQSRVSQAKILSGAGVIRNIVEEEGFSLAEVDYTLHWITRNLHARFSGAVKSLGVLPHVIGEALKEREHEDKRKEKRVAAVQKMTQDRQQVEGRRGQEGSLAELSEEYQEQLRQRAIRELQEEGIQARFMLPGLIKERILEILAHSAQALKVPL
jgi:hypothetical protein